MKLNLVFALAAVLAASPLLPVAAAEEKKDTAAARTIPLPGEHNAVNAECALRMAAALGADPARLAAAIRTFPGVERRLQRVGTCGRAVV